jgi:hypothetical protein
MRGNGKGRTNGESGAAAKRKDLSQPSTARKPSLAPLLAMRKNVRGSAARNEKIFDIERKRCGSSALARGRYVISENRRSQRSCSVGSCVCAHSSSNGARMRIST